MSEENSGKAFLNHIRDICIEVGNRNSTVDSNTLQEFLLRLQTCRVSCCRAIDVSQEANKVALAVRLRELNYSIQNLIDEVEADLYKRDPIGYVNLVPEILVHRTGLVGRPTIKLNLTQIEYLRTWRFVYLDEDMFCFVYFSHHSIYQDIKIFSW